MNVGWLTGMKISTFTLLWTATLPVVASYAGTASQPSTRIEAPRLQAASPLGRYASRTRQQKDEGGFTFGRLRLHPLLDTSYTYEDNVLATRAQTAERDFLLETSPGIELDYRPTESVRLNTSYRFGWVDYLDDNSKDYLTHDAAFSLVWKHAGLRGLTFSLQDEYTQTGNVDVFLDEFTSFSRLHGNRAAAQISYQANRFGIIGRYEHRLVDHFSRFNAPDDYYSHTGNLLSYYRLTDRNLQVYSQYQVSRFLFTNIDTEDFDTHFLRAGLRGRYRRMTFDGSIGNRRSYRRDTHDSDDGLAVHLSMTYKPSSRYTLLVNARQSFERRPQIGSLNELRFGADFQAHFPMGLKLDFDGHWLKEDRESGLRQQTWETGLTLSYQALKWVEVFVGYHRRERTNSASPSVTINRAQVGLTVRF